MKCGGLALLCSVVLGSAPARAQAAAPAIRVLADTDTRDCPGATELAFELDRNGSRRIRVATPGESQVFDVHFSLTDTGHRAQIRSPGGRVRTLDDTGTSCAELGKAAALALGLMVDDDARRRPLTTPPPAASPKPVDKPSTPTRIRVLLGAGVGLGLGGTRPLLEFGAGIAGPLDLELKGLATLPESQHHGPGVVELSWQGLGLRGCPELFDSLDLRPCGGLSLTRLSAQGRGYDASNERVTRWLAGLTLSVRLRGKLVGPLGWRLAGELDLHPARERFVVAGVEGAAFETAQVSGLLGLGLDGTF